MSGPGPAAVPPLCAQEGTEPVVIPLEPGMAMHNPARQLHDVSPHARDGGLCSGPGFPLRSPHSGPLRCPLTRTPQFWNNDTAEPLVLLSTSKCFGPYEVGAVS